MNRVNPIIVVIYKFMMAEDVITLFQPWLPCCDQMQLYVKLGYC